MSSDAASVDECMAAEVLAASGLPALEARALLAHQLKVAREHLIARPDQRIAKHDHDRFMKLARRRLSGEPLAYLLGEREFYGRTFALTPAVLIPRPETELLVDTALMRFGPDREACVLDLGTGSGCIAITLALERPQWRVTATDVSPEALTVATGNAERLQATNVQFHEGSWFGAIAMDARFQLIVANPPYVAPGDPHLDALVHEPRDALVASDNGFACLQTVINGAPLHLSAGGLLALEHGFSQAAQVRKLFTDRGWFDIRTLTDLAGRERVTSARWSGAV